MSSLVNTRVERVDGEYVANVTVNWEGYEIGRGASTHPSAKEAVVKATSKAFAEFEKVHAAWEKLAPLLEPLDERTLRYIRLRVYEMEDAKRPPKETKQNVPVPHS
jgi:hypothetical protein